MLKKISIIAGFVSVFVFTNVASAATVTSYTDKTAVNWETTFVQVSFENESDKIVVELNGVQILEAKPDWKIIGEVAFLEKNIAFSFDINTAVDPHAIAMYSIVNGVKTFIK